MKYPWLRVVGFLLLFYLIIRGVLYLMVSTVGGDNKTDDHHSNVYIISSEECGERSADELFQLLKGQSDFDVQLVTPTAFMALPITPGAKIIVPPACDPYCWNYLGQPVVNRLRDWADTGSLVLTFSKIPDMTKPQGGTVLISHGFYQVNLTLSPDSTVLWFDEVVIDSADSGEGVLASARFRKFNVPVIRVTVQGRGVLISCLARPQVTAGAEKMVNGLLRIRNGETLQTKNLCAIEPMVFDSAMTSQVNLYLQALLTGVPSAQVVAITWLAEHHYPMARYAIAPLLFSADQTVVAAAAAALTRLHALNAIEPLKAAIQLQPTELRPLLRKAEQSLTSCLHQD